MRSSATSRRSQHRRLNLKRRHLAEQLEPRMLLAGDVATDLQQPLELVSTAAAQGEAVGSFADLNSFGSQLRVAVDEISRVVGAIGSSVDLSAEVPYVGSLLPVDVGNTSIIDTASVGSLFDLSARFEEQVAAPLRAFLDSVPNATPSQLIAEFDFLAPVSGVAGAIEGVRLNLDLQQQVESSIAALLEPITAKVGGLIDAVDGDALATLLPIDLSVDGFSIDVLRDTVSDVLALEIPDFSLEISRHGLPPIDFAAEVGFLSGGVVDGRVDFDFDFEIGLGNLFRDRTLDGTNLGGLISLETLSEIAAIDISDALDLNVGGDGLSVALPFDFDLGGFDSGGFLPVFTLQDDNPLDAEFPKFDLQVPTGAPYTADALLGFHSIDATSMLASLEQLGATLGLWEQGSLLNLPLPLGQDVTLGDAIGLADSYGGAVLQFLTDSDGLPSFNSVQELADAIPGLVSDATGDAIVYDPTTQLLTLSLDFVRNPDPIVTQANLNVLAGNESSPIATVQMTPGEVGVDNRLAITRNASLGLQLEIDLSSDSAAPNAIVDVAAQRRPDVRGWTPMSTIVRRLGLGHLSDIPQELEIRLHSGSVVTIDMGTADEHTTLDEWLSRGLKRQTGPVVRFGFDPFPSLNEDRDIFDSTVNRFYIQDLTFGTSTTEVLSTDEFWARLLNGFTPDPENPSFIYSEVLNSPTDLHEESTPLEKFFPTFATGLQEDNDPLEVSFADGTSRLIDFGPTFGRTIGDLMDALTIVESGQPILQASRSGDSIVLEDLTTPAPGGLFRIDWAEDEGRRDLGLFVQPSTAVPGSNRIEMASSLPELPYDGAEPINHWHTIGDVLRGTDHEDLIGTESMALVTLRDSSQHPITTGVLDADLSLIELQRRLFIEDGDEILGAAGIMGDRLFLSDQTSGGLGIMSVEDTTPGGGLFQALFIDHLDGRRQEPDITGAVHFLFSDSLSNLPGSEIDTVTRPKILVDTSEPVPLWTKVSTVLERMGNDSSGRQSADVTLRDGTSIALSVGRPNATTIGDVLKQGHWYRGVETSSPLIAELTWDDDQFTLHDYTTHDGTSELAIVLDSIEGSFWPDAIGFTANANDPAAMTGQPVQQTNIGNYGSPGIPLSTLLPVDTPFASDEDGSSMVLRLPNGEAQSVFFGTPQDTTLESVLEALTVRRGAEVLTDARVENHRIVVDYVGPDGDQPLELQWDLINNFSVWPAQFLPIGVFPSDQIIGHPFFPMLPGSETPPIDGETKVADTFRNKLLSADIENAVEQSISGKLRDGTDFTLSMGVVDEEITWKEMLQRMKVVDDDGEVLLEAALVDDQLVLIDHTELTPDGGLFFISESGSFFLLVDFIETSTDGITIDRDNDGRLISASLATHEIDSSTTLRELFGEAHSIYSDPNPPDVDVYANLIRPGTLSIFDFPALTPDMTLGELVDQTNDDIADQQVHVRLRDGRLVLTETGSIDNATVQSPPEQLEISTTARSFADLFVNRLRDDDYNAEVISRPLWNPGANSRVAPDSFVGDYLRSSGLGNSIGAVVTSPISVTLLDGTVETFDVHISDSTTLAGLANQFRIVRDEVIVMYATLEHVDTLLGAPNYRFVLADTTEPINSESTFSVMIDQTDNPPVEALLPSLIGLTGIDDSAKGRIAGPLLKTDSSADRARIKLTEPPRLHAEVSAIASDVNAEIRIGELLSAGIRDGHGQVTAVVDLVLVPPAGRDFLTLEELIGSSANPGEFLEITVSAGAEFGGEVFADFAGLNVEATPGNEPRIDFAWPDAITNEPNLRFQTDTLSFTHQNLDELLRFRNLSVQDITNLIRKVVDLVERISGEDLLDKPLPLVNKSLDDVLNTVDYVAELVDDIVADPNSTLQTLEEDLEQLLGLAEDALTLTFVPGDGQLRIDLDLEISAVDSSSTFNLDLADAGLSQLDGLVDLSASGNIDVSAGAALSLAVGLDLDELLSTNFDDAVVVYSSTGINADASVSAQDLAFDTSFLSLPVEVGPGRVQLDADGLSFDGSPDTLTPVTISVQPRDVWPGGFKSLTDVSAADFMLDFSGAEVGIDLPITLPALPQQPFQVQWDDLSSFQFDVLPTGQMISGPGNQIVVPDLAEAASNVGFLDALVALGTGLQGLFDSLDSFLGEEFLGIPLPIVGDALDGFIDFADDLRVRVTEEWGDAVGAESDEDQAVLAAKLLLFDALGPGENGNGLNILADANDDGVLTADDVGIDDDTEDEVSFRVTLGRQDLSAETSLDLGLGGSALGLDLTGEVGATFGYAFDIGFGFSLSQGPFLEFYDDASDPNDTFDVQFDFLASVENLMGEGRLGPLAITVEALPVTEAYGTNLSPEELAPFIAATRLDPNDPDTATHNAIRGSFEIDFDPGRYTLSNLGSLFQGIETQAALIGNLHTRVDTGINGGGEGLPSLVADLHLEFDRVAGSLSTIVSDFELPAVSVTNVGLDLGSFVRDVLAPVLEPVNKFLDPIRPILEQLTSEIPVVSDLIGPTTYVDLIRLFGNGGDTVATFVDSVANIAELIDIPLSSGDSLVLPLGNFDTTFANGAFTPSASGGAAGFDSFLDTVGDEAAAMRDYLRNIPQEEPQFDSTDPNKVARVTPGMFSIPLLQNPASAIGLLFGQDVDLLKYQAPVLDASFDFRASIPVFPAFSITFGGSFGAIVDFAFGYDTAGIFKFAESGRALDLLDGFFFDDRATFQNGTKVDDVPELTFRFAVTAGGEIDLKAAKAGVEIGLGAALLLDLNDPDLDGKVRFSEVLQNLQLGNAPGLGPLWVFDASGQLEVFMTAYAKAFGFRVQATLGPKVLVNFDFPRPEPANPVLGHVENGQLIVHIGPNSELRAEGNLEDGDESVYVSTDEDTGRTVITGFGTEQSFAGVTSVYIDAGDGDDTIVVEDTFALPVTAYGRAGRDDITGGAATLTAYGGSGDDVITGGSGFDVLHGNGTDFVGITQVNVGGQVYEILVTDNDLINGGDGNDLIFGDEGDDLIQAGGGNDRAHGGDGEDYVGGGDGNDALFGGDDSDVLSGDGGDDLVFGESEDGSGSGRDFLQGGPGEDHLDGGLEDDELFGGAGADDLFGGPGNDLLVGAITTRDNPDFDAIQPTLDMAAHTFDGGDGNDLIYGTAGIDTVDDLLGLNIVRTYENDDVITLGPGHDVVYSGDGQDVVDVGDGNNEVFSGNGFDIVIAGIGTDLIDLRPRIPGQGDSFGSQVTDAGGNNRILGDSGDDIITVTGLGSNFVDAGEGFNIVRTSVGSDVIRTGGDDDVIEAGDGDNDVSSGGGDDTVTTGIGNDHVRLGSGDDIATTNAGNDVVQGGRGDDIIRTGSGNDLLRGNDGNDILIAGVGNDTVRGDAGSDVIWGDREGVESVGLFADLVLPSEYTEDTSVIPFVALVPGIVEGASVEGSLDDGNDLLRGGDDFDLVFGGGGNDDIEGGRGPSYLDGGGGNDTVLGNSGPDVIRGGDGADDLRGSGHLDFVYGDGGADFILGDAGVEVLGAHRTFGQKLFGGPGNDTIYAYARTSANSTESILKGEYIDGGSGADDLLGNLRQDTIIGGLGDDLLEGDGLAGPAYAANPNPFTEGGGDLLIGGFGDDLLLGGGGDDKIWGGGNNDEIEGHAGADMMFGGGDIDFFRFDVDPAYAFGGDTIDGHFGNDPRDATPTPDDFATDILKIPGTAGTAFADKILLGGDANGNLVVQYNGAELDATIRDADGNALIEQFQVDGFAGDDVLGFLPSLDLSDLANRSRDWVGVFNGGAGDDTITGSAGRDRLDGGRGSDFLQGFAGDDRLWGDSGIGSSGDVDTLLAGSGNDDLLGGVGRNELYAWSELPGAVGPNFGVFTPDGQLEDTGLNRMLGRDNDDLLFAGTGLDFMYGGEGTDTLHGVDGVPIEFGIGVPEDEEWLEYARGTDKVWYYGGSGAADVITVDYVTEPGVLGDHHLITRLTENNGFFTFDAQVQLDFAATNRDGSLVWDPADLVVQLEEIQSIEDDDERALATQSLQLNGDLLPPEGDYLAIIIAAGDGDDQVYVGPTVQRSVWVAAGDGNDRVEFASGTSLLVDLADTEGRNEVLGDATDASNAFSLVVSDETTLIDQTTLFTRLTLDSPRDVDWYEINMQGVQFGDKGKVIVDSVSRDDQIKLELFELDEDSSLNLLGTGQLTDNATFDSAKNARYQIDLRPGGAFTSGGIRYFIRVQSSAEIPTQYDLGIDLGTDSDTDPDLGDVRVDLGVESDTFLRRDVIVGGAGADVLKGGPSEDWVIGGPGNDVLTGGEDGGASDIIIGEDGDDIFQIIPSDLGGGELLTLADELDGSDGYDRVLYLGGDLDAFGQSIRDHVSLRYDPSLARYELIAKVWDTANQSFMTNEAGDEFLFYRDIYRTRGIEATVFDLRDGDDELHLESEYNFTKPDGSVDVTQTYGIDFGDRQAGGHAISFTVDGGNGNDRIFGSPYSDVIRAGAGFDLVLGGGGKDVIDGEGGSDLLIGDEASSNVPLWDDLETSGLTSGSVSNGTPLGATWLDLSSGQSQTLTLHDGDLDDWYVLPNPGFVPSDINVQFFMDSFSQQLFGLDYQQPTVEILAASANPNGTSFIPTEGNAEVYLLRVRNPLSSAIVADVRPSTDLLFNPYRVDLRVRLDGPFSLPKTLSVTVAPNADGQEIAEILQGVIEGSGLDDQLFAAFDVQRDRLILQSLTDADLIVEGNFASGIRYLGFTDGQTNDGIAGPLGSYRIVTSQSFPTLDSAPLFAATPASYELASADVNFLAPVPSSDLSSLSPSLDQALRIEGSTSQENLSEVVSVGDVNGDGRTDMMLVGNDFAYVYLGNVDVTASTVAAIDTADFVLDISAGYRPIPGPIDLDNDGLHDFAFWRQSESDRSVSISVVPSADLLVAPTIFSSIRPGDRVFDIVALDRNVVSFGTDRAVEAFDFQWLNYDGDNTPDLMAISRTPVVQSPSTSAILGYGYVFDGELLADQLDGGTPSNFVRKIFIDDFRESGSVIGGSIDGDLDSATPFDDRVFAAAGDFDGDGEDEIVLTRPRGWTFDSVTEAEPLVVARTYLLDTDGADNQNVSLGEFGGMAPAIMQHFEVQAGIGGELNGAISTTHPLTVGDLDRDGVDDLIVARETERGDKHRDALMIYRGQTVATMSAMRENTEDVDKVLRDVTYPFDQVAGVSVGDFDSDGQVDLAIGQSERASGNSAVTVVFDVMAGSETRLVGDAVGDARVDSVSIVNAATNSQLGALPLHSFDITGDRIDDLVVGASRLDTTNGAIDGGGVFVFAGSQRVLPLPSDASVTELANDSIRGFGDILRDANGVIDNEEQLLKPGSESVWYRFTTAGDGAAGDRLRVGPTVVGEPELLLGGVSGSVSDSGSVGVGSTAAFGDIDGTGVIEFDLARLLSSYETPEEIIDAKLHLVGSATAEQVDFDMPVDPQGLTRTEPGDGFGERIFFSASNDAAGRELWVTDGTPDGTKLVFDAAPGQDWSDPSNLTAVGHRLVFSTSILLPGSESFQRQLFITDGDKTTEILRDNQSIQNFQNGSLTEHNGSVYFLSGFVFPQLMRIEIGQDGATSVREVTAAGDDFQVDAMRSTGAGLFLNHPTGSADELYITDGSRVELVKKFASGSLVIADAIETNAGLVFAADDTNGAGQEPWVSDGTESGTILLIDASAGAAGSGANSFVSLGGSVRFIANGTDLWTTDGTPDNTKVVRSLYSSTLNGERITEVLATATHHVAMARISEGKFELVSTDASGAETARHSVTAGRYVVFDDAGVFGNKIMLGYASQEAPFEESPEDVGIFDPVTGSFQVLASETKNVHNFNDFVEIDGKVLFEGYIDDNSLDSQLWISDGTSADPLFDANSGGAAQGGVVTVTIRGDDFDGQISGPEAEANPVLTHTVTLGATSREFTVDLIQDREDLERLRDLFRLGYRSLITTFTIDSGVGSIDAPKPESGTGLQVTRRGGVQAQLLDESGRLIADEFVALDLRNLAAGTYYLGVSRDDHALATDTIPVRVVVDAPSLGNAHQQDSNDTVSGGDGDDVVVGGGGRDQLVGNSGTDTFVGEFYETRDVEPLEVIRDALAAELFAASQSGIAQRDPAVVIAAATRGAISIADRNLAQAIADAIGVDLVQQNGSEMFSQALYVSDLASLAQLDASSRGITSIDGLSYLVGLETLDLSGNQSLDLNDLNELAPALNNTQGMPNLRHLNLDDNLIRFMGPLEGLAELRVLSIADQNGSSPLFRFGLADNFPNLMHIDISGNNFSDVAPLGNSPLLVSANLADNPIALLGPLAGTYVVDDLDAKATDLQSWFYGSDTLSIQGSYQVADLNLARDAEMTWRTPLLLPGEYEVLATWHADASHSSKALFQYGDRNSLKQSFVNQQIDPNDANFGGKPFESLGTYTLQESAELLVQLSGVASDGSLIADAIFVRPVQRSTSLAHVNVRGTQLDGDSRQLIVGDFEKRGVVVDIDSNRAPVWSGLPTSIAWEQGDGHSLGDLNDFASDPERTVLTYSVTSGTPGITLARAGTEYKINAATAPAHAFSVLLTATDADGLSTTHHITAAVDASIVEGRVLADDGIPVEGAVVFAGDGGGVPKPGQSSTVTTQDGRYRLYVPNDQDVTIDVAKQQSWFDVIAQANVSVRFNSPVVTSNVDFDVQRAISIGLPPIANEGDSFTATFTSIVQVRDISWDVTGGPVTIDDSDTNNVVITPRNEGTYTVTATAVGQNETYKVTRTLTVASVLPVAKAGADAVISEGRFSETRPLIVDPGDDSWFVTVDYGDGSEPKTMTTTDRDFDFDHIYGDAGVYTVSVSVRSIEGPASSDAFQVDVRSDAPFTALILDNTDDVVKGQPGNVTARIVDPSFQANRFTWSYSIDWGDGTVDDLADAFTIINLDASRVLLASLSHVYQSEGDYEIVLSVVDDDGDTAVSRAEVTVVNDTPTIDLAAPGTLAEKTVQAFSVIAEDQDGIQSIEWDFGDGSPTVTGASVSHAFTQPGTYEVEVAAVDQLGFETIVTRLITIEDVNEGPRLESIVDQVAYESISFMLQMSALDPDVGDTLSYSLSGAPAGLSIDNAGVITWTPTGEQSLHHYDFDVVVTDALGLSASESVSIDVRPTGSISGLIFEDENSNGRFDLGEVPVPSVLYRLDIGNDGTFDRQRRTPANGDMLFDNLTAGLHRVVAFLPDGSEATTPTEFLVDMTVVDDVVLSSIGGSSDSDGDGVSNLDEQNVRIGLDNNQDGIADWLQGNVATVSTVDKASVTIISAVGTQLSGITTTPTPSDAPDGGRYTHGALQFAVDGIALGGNANVELKLHADASINAVYRFGQSNGQANQYQLLTPSDGAQVIDDVITLQVQDGDALDADRQADGRVVQQLLPSFIGNSWTNPLDSLDVDGNGAVSPLDVILIINRIADFGFGDLPGQRLEGEFMYDVSGDGRLTGLDAIIVINDIADRSDLGQGERIQANDAAIGSLFLDDDDREAEPESASQDPPSSLF